MGSAGLIRPGSLSWRPGHHVTPGATPEVDSRPSRLSAREIVRALVCLCLGALLVLVLAANVPRLWGWHPVVVTSGSMMPLIHPGDVVVERPNPKTVAKDDVVTYRQAGTKRLITHRVVDRDPTGDYTIKGDANTQADPQPVPPGRVVGQVRMLVPLVGWPSVEFHRHPAPAVAATAIAGIALISLRRRRNEPRHRRRRGHRASRPGWASVTPVLVLGLTGCLFAGIAVMQNTGAVLTASRTNSTNSVSSRGNFAFPNQVIADGPISYWPLDETSGTTGNDIVGSNTFTYHAGVTLGAAGSIAHDSDKGVHVSSTAGYATTANNPSTLNLTGSFSVMVWERATSWPETTNGRLLSKYDGTNLNYLIAWDSAGTSMRFLLDTVGGSPVRPTAITSMTNDGLWHMVIGTWDGANAKLYIDGVLKNTASATGVTSAKSVTSPVTLAFTTSSAISDEDEAAIWGRTLSASEISTLYSAGTT
jgi:signal peptidase I